MWRYRSNVCVTDLGIDECTVHRAGNDSGARWWLLWFRVLRDDNGQPMDACVPINPRGSFIEAGPGGKTWGVTSPMMSPGLWNVAPSINVLGTGAVHHESHTETSMWHHTPSIDGVPIGEAWTIGNP